VLTVLFAEGRAMALPKSLLKEVEEHSCFSGCYRGQNEVYVCFDGSYPLEKVVVAACEDCLMFEVAALQSMLPAGTTCKQFAQELTRHVRHQRGYHFSFAGYHTAGPGFWLSGVYYSQLGCFLLDGERSRSLGSDLDLLMLAYQHKIVNTSDPRMLDLAQYKTQTVYLSRTTPLVPVGSRHDLLSLPQVQAQPPGVYGWKRVTMAEFQPIASLGGSARPGRARTGSLSSKANSPAPIAQLPVGSVCPVCKAEVRERPLLNGTYVGCLC
jgi:hypothetical protein